MGAVRKDKQEGEGTLQISHVSTRTSRHFLVELSQLVGGKGLVVHAGKRIPAGLLKEHTTEPGGSCSEGLVRPTAGLPGLPLGERILAISVYLRNLFLVIPFLLTFQ